MTGCKLDTLNSGNSFWIWTFVVYQWGKIASIKDVMKKGFCRALLFTIVAVQSHPFEFWYLIAKLILNRSISCHRRLMEGRGTVPKLSGAYFYLQPALSLVFQHLVLCQHTCWNERGFHRAVFSQVEKPRRLQKRRTWLQVTTPGWEAVRGSRNVTTWRSGVTAWGRSVLCDRDAGSVVFM